VQATLAQSNQLVRDADVLATLDSPQLTMMLERPVSVATVAAERLLDKCFWRLVVLLVLGLLLALLYRWLSLRWRPRRDPP
jgi:hypothetical protein